MYGSYKIISTEEELQKEIEEATCFETVELSADLATKLNLVCEKCGKKIDWRGNRVYIHPHGRVHPARTEVYCISCNYKDLLRLCDKGMEQFATPI